MDLFAGGCNLSVNVDAKKILANDTNEKMIQIYQYFKENPSHEVIKKLEQLVQNYGLSNSSRYGFERYDTTSMLGVAKYNKKGFEKLRSDYNADKSPLMLFMLIIFSFNNQIRFNPLGDFNSSVNKRDFNDKIKKNLQKFIDKLKSIDISLSAFDYKNVEILSDSFVYLDPPYLISKATYNEKNAWDEKQERELLEYIDALDAKGIKFALSNVFQSKSKKNHLLIEWSERYRVHKLSYSYHNCNYQNKNKNLETTDEVLITNY